MRTLGIAALATAGSVGASRGVYELLAAQARIARRVIPQPTTWPFNGDGLYHPGHAEPERWRPGMEADFELMIFGDSTAAGLGASSAKELPGVLLARGLAEESGKTVRLSTKAIVGATSKGLWSQIEAMQITGGKPDLSVILVGGNDITSLNGMSSSARRLGQAVQVLVDSGSEVVVGTCPDLGIIRPVPQPLRSVMRAWSLRLAALQAGQARAAGGVPVRMAKYMTSEFLARPEHFFSADQFHPHSAGYELAAAILLPPALIALGVWSEEQAAAADRASEHEAEEFLDQAQLEDELIREHRVFEPGAVPEKEVRFPDEEGAALAEGAATSADAAVAEPDAGAKSTELEHDNTGAVVQQLMWRLVHVLRPGDKSAESEHSADDSPFDSDVFAHERAVYLDPPEEEGTSAVMSGDAEAGEPLDARTAVAHHQPGDGERAESGHGHSETRSAAARFFRLSRFRPPALPRIRPGGAGADNTATATENGQENDEDMRVADDAPDAQDSPVTHETESAGGIERTDE